MSKWESCVLLCMYLYLFIFNIDNSLGGEVVEEGPFTSEDFVWEFCISRVCVISLLFSLVDTGQVFACINLMLVE